jgi:hypothetical protein
MVQAAQRTAPAFLSDEFNRFLFAFVGTERSGRELSVISALARLDLDAWAEAANLARLPRDVAASNLSAMLRRYTEIPQIVQESRGIAVRLIALLPDRVPSRIYEIAKPARLPASEAFAVSAALLAFAMLFGILYFSQSHPQAGVKPAAATHTTATMPSP